MMWTELAFIIFRKVVLVIKKTKQLARFIWEDYLQRLSIVAFPMVTFTVNKCTGSNKALNVVTFGTPQFPFRLS